MNRRRGFTLIELSVVIVILAVLGAVMVPNMGKAIASHNARKYRSDVRNLFAFAREEAIRSGKTRTVLFGDSGFTVSADSEDESRTLKSVPTIDLVKIDEFFVDGNSVGESDWSLRFYADGRSDSGRFNLSDGGSAVTYRIKPDSGLVEVLATQEDLDQLNDEDRWPAGEVISAR